MTRRRAKAPSQRQLRVGEQLRHALADLLGRDAFNDPALAGVSVTVTEVRVSPDLKVATAYVVPFAVEDADGVLAALQRAEPAARRHLARTVNLRYTPELRFAADTSFDEASRIEALLRSPRVARDLDHPSSDTGSHDGEQ